MSLKGNMLVKILVGVFALIVVIVVIKGCSSSSEKSAANRSANQNPQLTPEEMSQLGISDTPQDTVATLVGKVNQLQAGNQQRDEQLQKLMEENSKLADRAKDVRGQVREEIRNHSAQNDTENRGMLSQLQRQVDQLTHRSNGQNQQNDEDYPVGLGLGDKGTAASSASDLQWVDPMDAHQEINSNGRPTGEATYPHAFDTAFDAAGDSAKKADAAFGSGEDIRESVSKGKKHSGETEEDVDPRYTVPENSTLMGSLSMTALLGRIPVNGTVNDPYPFKALIGRDNLTANGIEIPELQAAVVSGTASGDWTLSCVRGKVESMTFIFEDGTIRTLPEPENARDDNNDDSKNDNNQIGWISDNYGLPCIAGQRRSNAKQYLGTQALLTAAGAGVASLMSNDDNNGSTTMNTDGSMTQAMSGSQAVDQIMGQGVSDMSKWVNQLYGQAFAAVYVPPGKHIAIHIDKELRIDFEKQGRKVHYDSPEGGAGNELD
ncbi:TIGR03752 family integrating conjugative element protein [Carnimonas bestiolae]|uniref:TIGR03752 family integrating conjugative element protein n=1 Tax=Carnimonas bestiolae TaxID=3402172 RepID=UPI003EDBBBF2